MKNKFFLIGLAGFLILAPGCNKDNKPLLQKAKTREQANKAIEEVEKLERNMRQVQELEKIEKESERITNLKEPLKPPTENQ